MRIVDKAIARPHMCAVYPQIPHDHPDGFIDTGNELYAIEPHIYVSRVAVRDMARLFGFPLPDDMDELQERLAVAEAELAELREQVGRLEAERDRAVDVLRAVDVIESEGFRARKKAGRPPKKTDEVAA